MHQLGLTQTPLNDRSIALLRFIAKHSQTVAHSPCLSPLLSQPTPTRLSSSARHQNGFYEQHLTHSHLTEQLSQCSTQVTSQQHWANWHLSFWDTVTRHTCPCFFCSISLVSPGKPHLWLPSLTWSPRSSAQGLSTFLTLLDDPRSSHDFKYLHSYMLTIPVLDWGFTHNELLINSPWMSYRILNSRGFLI